MSLEIGRFTPTASATYAWPPTRAERPAAAHAADAAKTEFDTIVGDVPPAPTEEVRDQVAAAAQRVDELAAENRELHFTKDQDSGRVIIEVRDLAGKVLRTIPPSRALDIMSGGQL